MKSLYYWLPPILWMTAITIFSTDIFAGGNTGSLLWTIFHRIFPNMTEEQFQPIHFLIRKAAHLTEFGILALLLYRAIRSGSVERWRWSWAVYTLAIVIVFALLDEYHQTFTRNRVGSIYDSLTDISGGLTALLSLWLWRRMKGVNSQRNQREAI